MFQLKGFGSGHENEKKIMIRDLIRDLERAKETNFESKDKTLFRNSGRYVSSTTALQDNFLTTEGTLDSSSQNY